MRLAVQSGVRDRFKVVSIIRQSPLKKAKETLLAGHRQQLPRVRQVLADSIVKLAGSIVVYNGFQRCVKSTAISVKKGPDNIVRRSSPIFAYNPLGVSGLDRKVGGLNSRLQWISKVCQRYGNLR